jgi:hypothetical protein
MTIPGLETVQVEDGLPAMLREMGPEIAVETARYRGVPYHSCTDGHNVTRTRRVVQGINRAGTRD